MAHKPIKLMTFNVRSLKNNCRQIELSNILHNNQIDVGFIQECHLHVNRRVKINGYNFVYDNSPLGVAIAIKNNIHYNRINCNTTQFNTVFIEIEITTNNITKKYLLGSIYIPCVIASQELNDSLNQILHLANNFDGFMFGGDLNAKSPNWGDIAENANGKALHDWLQNNCLDVTRICDKSPSFPNGSSFLDHFLLSPCLVNCVQPNYYIKSLPTFSDHFPLVLELENDSAGLLLRSPQVITSYKNTDWNAFSRDLEAASISILPPNNCNLNNDELDVLIETFDEKLTLIHDNHSSKLEINDRKHPYPDNIKKFLKVKYAWQKKLKKIYHRTGNKISSEYKILSNQIQLLKQIINELIKLEDAKNFRHRLSKITPGPTAFKEVYQMIGKNKSPFCQQLVYNDTLISGSSQISEIFKTYYTTVFQEVTPERPINNIESQISSCIDRLPQRIYTFDASFSAEENHDTYHFTSEDTIKTHINNINSKKSFGFDGISNFLIKKFPNATLKFLAVIFNNCINNGYFPLAWKKAKILPIKKNRTVKSLRIFVQYPFYPTLENYLNTC